ADRRGAATRGACGARLPSPGRAHRRVLRLCAGGCLDWHWWHPRLLRRAPPAGPTAGAGGRVRMGRAAAPGARTALAPLFASRRTRTATVDDRGVERTAAGWDTAGTHPQLSING